MRKKAPGLAVVLVCVLITITNGAQERAEMAIINGKIYTVAEQNPWAEAVAVRDGKIIAIGEYRDVRRYINRDTHVIDVEGQLVIPGFHDSHCHFASGGRSLTELNVASMSVEMLQERIAERVRELPEGTPIFGTGSFPW